MEIKFSPPDITQAEIDEVVDTLKSGWITSGPKVKRFEEQISAYCNTEKTIALNSATAALELILRLFEIGPGDEVITSAYTYSASASVIDHVGARIVLCDIEKDSLKLDKTQLESLITHRTKAIIPVDVAGIIEDYRSIYEIIERKRSLFKPYGYYQEELGRILVLADAAHSLGSVRNGKMSGHHADFTAFSFHAVKNLTTAEGGALTWLPFPNLSDTDMYYQLGLLSLHGQTKSALEKMKLDSWEYDIASLGYKNNLTDLCAAIGLAQLKRYDSMLQRRKQIVEMYDNGFAGSRIWPLPHEGSNFSSCRHLYITRIEGFDVEQRNQVIQEMTEKGIPTNVHYKPLPMFTAYKRLGFDIEQFPNAYNFYRNELTLPLHTLLRDDQVEYIIKSYKELV